LGIKAGEGIKAGLSISCKRRLSFAYNLFAGICTWKKVSNDEKTITCGKLEPRDTDSKIEYGVLNEIGLPNEIKTPSLSGKEVKIILDGVEYVATIK